MKPKLILLSDLWGHEKGAWIQYYTELLRPYFECQYYDCCKLGEVNKSPYEQEHLHQQFVNSGIEKAVAKLLELEQGEIFILAFSIGGIIAWRAALEGLKIRQLWAISATRLRYETERPDIPIHLVFGEKDNYRPQLNWLSKMKAEHQTILNQRHDFYCKYSFANEICNSIIGV